MAPMCAGVVCEGGNVDGVKRGHIRQWLTMVTEHTVHVLIWLVMALYGVNLSYRESDAIHYSYHQKWACCCECLGPSFGSRASAASLQG